MARIVVQELVIFLLPFLLYGAYFLWRKRQARLAGQPEPVWEHTHWYWLVVIGLLLAIAAFMIGEALVPADPRGVYRPPTSPR